MRVHNKLGGGGTEGRKVWTLQAKLKLCGFQLSLFPLTLTLPAPAALFSLHPFACTGHAALFIPPTPNNSEAAALLTLREQPQCHNGATGAGRVAKGYKCK